MMIKKFFLLSFSFLFLITSSLSASPIISGESIVYPTVRAKNGVVSTQDAIATLVGLDILKKGGNAIDAAVAIGFALAVTLPRAGNLGGGGFMLIYLAEKEKVIALDYREKAPLKATREMFLDKDGNADSKKSQNSILAVGVPGTVAGLAHALKEYGTISLDKAIAPAIQLAEEGFPVHPAFIDSLRATKESFQKSPTAKEIFLQKDPSEYKVGDLFVQKDLAWSLGQIRDYGPAAFYYGAIADKIIAFMNQERGLITKDDLIRYKPVIREPIHGTYRDHDIYSMPPPSSGGVHIVQILNLLEEFPISEYGHNTAKTIHHMAEAMKLAYADRAKYLGDSDFVSVPIKTLTSKEYAKKLREKINTQKATPSASIGPGEIMLPQESNETTHFSVMDKDGNVVSNTYTLNFSYGSKIVVPGTGILLNNEMDDFVSKPGVPNAYGLVGGDANAIEPEKRMLSSMSPTIVMKDKKPFLITGSPGGSRIITTVLQIIMNIIDHGMNLQEAINAVRVHHQWLPDELRVEKGLNNDTKDRLKAMGHTVIQKNAMGAAESILKEEEYIYGAHDPRRSGLATGY